MTSLNERTFVFTDLLVSRNPNVAFTDLTSHVTDLIDLSAFFTNLHFTNITSHHPLHSDKPRRYEWFFATKPAYAAAVFDPSGGTAGFDPSDQWSNTTRLCNEDQKTSIGGAAQPVEEVLATSARMRGALDKASLGNTDLPSIKQFCFVDGVTGSGLPPRSMIQKTIAFDDGEKCGNSCITIVANRFLADGVNNLPLIIILGVRHASLYDGMYWVYMVTVPILCLALLIVSMTIFSVARKMILSEVAREVHPSKRSGSGRRIAPSVTICRSVGRSCREGFCPQGFRGWLNIYKYGFYWVLILVGFACAEFVVVASWYAYQVLPYDWEGVPTHLSGEDERPGQLARGALQFFRYGLVICLASRIWVGSYDVSEVASSVCCCCPCALDEDDDDDDDDAADDDDSDAGDEDGDRVHGDPGVFGRSRSSSTRISRKKADRKVQCKWGAFILCLAVVLGMCTFLKQALEPASIDECRYCDESDNRSLVSCYE